MPQLNIYHRAQIFLGIQAGKTDATIAKAIGVHRSTVGREIERNGGRKTYDLWSAQRARDLRQGQAVKARMLFGGGVLFNSRLRKLNLKYAHLSHCHIHWYDQDSFPYRFARLAEAYRYRPYKVNFFKRKTNQFKRFNVLKLDFDLTEKKGGKGKNTFQQNEDSHIYRLITADVRNNYALTVPVQWLSA
ncbi:hypothetical protein FUAX_41280 (plasmid) [Fulvitalea axinellae]|uniref:Transposase IS30-like HTH domain-containing protein n=1 Tax=Fulvitalea axinellae TaxID=1182444 RepID=A0AAU9DEW1_9BACT|nr:hypothetical protein FUAX_41280 [Fulvitalea axinellae]